MKKYFLYKHSGSGNHGCEALVRTISSLIPSDNISVFSSRSTEDEFYLNDLSIKIFQCGRVNLKKSLSGIISLFKMKFLHDDLAYIKNEYASLLTRADKNTIALSIGGDNYCYDGVPKVLADLNLRLMNKKAKTALIGCSIEPELLNDKDIVEDLKRYSLITARESITYNALIGAGIDKNTHLIPDSAFLLPTVTKEVLPKDFTQNGVVGINLSPLVLDEENGSSMLYKAYCNLIEYILDKTEMNILLIPHVVWDCNNDLTPLRQLFDLYKNSKRIRLVEDAKATEIKGYIAQCRFFVGARTHSTIAAYSCCVPTLVAGYSVKSLGIAKDLFGTSDGYVVSSKGLTDEFAIVNGFINLMTHEEEIIAKLRSTIPAYKESINILTEKIKEL